MAGLQPVAESVRSSCRMGPTPMPLLQQRKGGASNSPALAKRLMEGLLQASKGHGDIAAH